MKKNKVLALVLMVTFLVMSIGIAGCGGADKKAADTGGDKQQTTKLKLGHIFAPDNANSVAADKFAKLIKERTDGRVEVAVFGNSQLGGDRELAEGLERGTIDMSFINPGSLAGFDPMYDFDNLYMIDSYKVADAIWASGSFCYKSYESTLAKHGMTLLALGENDFRHISNNKHPITKVSDLKGLKIRVPGTPILMNDFKLPGAIPTEMSFGELYTGLQQKTIDGQENGVVMTYASKFYEVQPYFTHSYHAYTPVCIVVSTKVWDKLSAEDQKILKDTAIEMGQFQIKLNRENVKEYEQKMKDAGVKFSEFEPAEYEKLQQMWLTNYKYYEGKVGKDFVDQLKTAVNEARKSAGAKEFEFPQ